MVHFVGAGCGAPDLITVRGARLIAGADVLIYAGSLVNPEVLKYAGSDCEIHDSARLTLEQVIEIVKNAEARSKTTVRLHTGDSSIYGAVREQIDLLESLGIAYDVCPGVSSLCAAAASLKAEYTLPDVSQTVIITRMEGRTSVPEREKLRALAAHGSSMVLFLSAGLLDEVQNELMAGGYAPETPAAIIYKATWPEERVFRCHVSDLASTAEQNDVQKTALIVVGGFLGGEYERSKLYDPDFSTEYRKAQI